MAEGSVVFGFHAVTARLRHSPASVKEVLIDERRHDPRLKRLLELAAGCAVKVQATSSQRLDGFVRGGRHQGVIALVSAVSKARDLEDVLAEAGAAPLLLVLDGVQDPHNLGACLRVADALGANAVVAPKDRAVGLTPTVEKVASGAAETTPYIMVTNLARSLRSLQEAGLWVIGTAQDASSAIGDCDLRRGVALVLGAEGQGMRRLTAETCDQLAAIPMVGAVESLNVSVAAGICLYEARRQRDAVTSSSTVSP
jgi:23S rRNA (guanosine2251-2'-O)-methyltransferase